MLGGVHRHEKGEGRLSHARAGGEHVERACPQPSHKPVQSPQPGMYARRTAPGYPLAYLPYPCHGLGGGGRHVRYLVGEGELLAQFIGHRSQFRYQLLRIPVVGRRLMRQLVAPQDKPPCHEGLPYVLAMLPYELSAYLHVAVLPGQLEEVGQLPGPLRREPPYLFLHREYIRSFPLPVKAEVGLYRQGDIRVGEHLGPYPEGDLGKALA